MSAKPCCRQPTDELCVSADTDRQGRLSCDLPQASRYSYDPASPVCPIHRFRQAEAEVLDGGTARIHAGNRDDNSGSPESAPEDCDNADDGRMRVAAQTLRHAVQLQIHRVSPAARLLGSRVVAVEAGRKLAAGESTQA